LFSPVYDGLSFRAAVYFSGICLAAPALFLCAKGGIISGGAKSGRGRKPFPMLFALLAVFFAGSLSCALELEKKDPLESRAGETSEISGMVLSVEAADGDYYRMAVRTESGGLGIRGGKALVRVTGSIPAEIELTGRTIRATGKVSLPEQRRNPGCFDYRMYLKTQNIRIILSCDSSGLEIFEGRLNSPERILLNRLAALKSAFFARLSDVMDEQSVGVMAGMLFGDTSMMDDELYESFQQNGVAHILSVSGIHVAIVYMMILRAFGGRRDPLSGTAALILLFFYAALSQFSPSVVRASLMIAMHIFAGLLRRRYDLMTGTAAAALIMLAVQPLQLFQVGFQLSFLAVFSLAFLTPFVDRLLEPANKKQGGVCARSRVVSALVPIFVIQAGMTPVTAYFFNYFSLSSLALNPPVIFLSGLILPLGLALMPLSAIGGTVAGKPVFGVAAAASELLIKGMTRLSDLAADVEGSSFWVPSPPAWTLFIYYGLLFFLCSESARIVWQRRQFRRVTGRALAIVCCAALAGASPVYAQNSSALVFVDVGQGDCLHIRTPDGKNILIDGGGSIRYNVGKKTLLPYLLKNGVSKIDLALVTHLHTDHFQGIAELSQEIKIGRLAVYEGNRLRRQEIEEAAKISDEEILYVHSGQRLSVGKSVYIDILFPQSESEEEYERMIITEEDENKSSLLMRLSYGDVKVLMTGDLSADAEARIMRELDEKPGGVEMLRSDILKAGHHGSRYSTSDEFLETVSPKLCVFQVGKNNFGHPHPTVLEKCEKRNIMIYRNDSQGAVMIDVTGGGRIRVKTMI
jgi:competence protein ComEC